MPVAMQKQMIEACHLQPPYYHPGIKRTKNAILKVANWPGIHAQVSDYIKTCPTCQRYRAAASLDPLERSLAVPEGPFQVVHVDHFEVSIRGENFKFLTMIDAFTKWPEVQMVTTKGSEEAARVIFSSWIIRFGVPRKIVGDQAFGAAVIRNLCTRLGANLRITMPYRPQSNATIEVFHKQLNKALRCSIIDDNADIEQQVGDTIAIALWSYRTGSHSSLLETPAYMLYGQDPVPPLQEDWRFTGYREDRLTRLAATRNDVLLRWYHIKAFSDSTLR